MVIKNVESRTTFDAKMWAQALLGNVFIHVLAKEEPS